MNKNIKKVKVRDLETLITNYNYRGIDYHWNDISKGLLSQIPEYLDKKIREIQNIRNYIII